MMPTLALGDRVNMTQASKLTRGDIITFNSPCSSEVEIGRVVGVGDDIIETRCFTTYVNGRALSTILLDPVSKFDYIEPKNGSSYPVTVSRYREVSLNDIAYEIFDGRERPQMESHGVGKRDFPRHSHIPGCTGDRQGTVVSEKAPDICSPQLHFVVPKGMVFVLNDWREATTDSRSIGVIRASDVVGRLAN